MCLKCKCGGEIKEQKRSVKPNPEMVVGNVIYEPVCFDCGKTYSISYILQKYKELEGKYVSKN